LVPVLLPVPVSVAVSVTLPAAVPAAVPAAISAAISQPLFPPRSCRIPVVLALRFRILFSPFFLPPLPGTIRPFALQYNFML
jgi:hypothetical protein